MKLNHTKKIFLLPLLTLFCCATLSIFILDDSSKKIGKSFPGYLTFENGLVGSFYLPSWPHQEKIQHRTLAPVISEKTETFSIEDFILIAILPICSGLLFTLLGLGIFIYLPNSPGKQPLFYFHILVGIYLILSPDFHLTHRFSYLLLSVFTFIPATILHFANSFPEQIPFFTRKKIISAAPYALSFSLGIPYLYWFTRNPSHWLTVEYIVVGYLVLAYLYWLLRLTLTRRRSHIQWNQIIARYLLAGQIVAFAPLLFIAAIIFLNDTPFPLNLAAPITLLFPISLFIGTILGRLRQSQLKLLAIERKATVGNLVSGLAHELNNPMNFIYANLEPFEESLHHLKKTIRENSPEQALNQLNELDNLRLDIALGAERSKKILESFSQFHQVAGNTPQKKPLLDLLAQSVQLLKPKWSNRILIKQAYEASHENIRVPEELAQVFINILANACEAIPKTGKVFIKVLTEPTSIQIIIEDSGIGIPKSSLTRIFDPFFSLKETGTGLGLALSLEIVGHYHGTLEIHSEEDIGTTCIINLPHISHDL